MGSGMVFEGGKLDRLSVICQISRFIKDCWIYIATEATYYVRY